MSVNIDHDEKDNGAKEHAPRSPLERHGIAMSGRIGWWHAWRRRSSRPRMRQGVGSRGANSQRVKDRRS